MARGGRIAAAVASGLLSGAGKALQLTAEQKFQEKIENLREKNRAQERAEDRDFQREMEGERQFSQLARDTMQIKGQERRDAAQDESAERRHRETLDAQERRGRADADAAGERTQASQAQMVRRKDGTLVWAYPDGTTKKVMDGDKPLEGEPVKPGAAGDDDPSLLTAAEQRTWNAYRQTHTDRMGNVDNKAALRNLAKENRALAEKIAQQKLGPNGETAAEARELAEAEAKNKKSFWKGRESEFSEDGGDPEQFIARRTAEIMGGQAAPEGGPGTAMAGEAPKVADSAPKTDPQQGKPSGEGTREKPYAATTQADIDWFKAHAPKGAVIVVNGQTFIK